jgi:hypothetical protein
VQLPALIAQRQQQLLRHGVPHTNNKLN